MSFDLLALQHAVARDGRVARVVVAAARGSAPREPGAAMLVGAESEMGTIGGGALEFEATRAARKLLAENSGPRVSRHALGPALGQCCGGAVTLVTEVWEAASLADLVPERPVLRRVEGAEELPFGLRARIKEARGSGAAMGVQFQQGWLAEPITRPTRPVWVHGAGHVGRALVALLAPLPELAITWTDTSLSRFPTDVPGGVTVLPAPQPAALIPHAPRRAEHYIMTFSHDLDLQLCHALLSSGFARAGLIGSDTKWARFRTRLGQLGHAPDEIARITCPIGDPAMGRSPQAIAIGVAASLLADSAHAASRAENRA